MRKGWLAITALVLLAGCSRTPTGVVSDVARTLGAANVKTIQYSGSGAIFALGQSVNPNEAWPRFNLKSYTRTVDYEKEALREEEVRTQFEDPPRGGGLQPVIGERRAVAFASGDKAWNVGADGVPVPAPAAAEERHIQIWLTPHGWAKAAAGANPTMESKTVDGKQVTVVSFSLHGKYKVNGYVNGQNLLEKVETWLPNPVLGDMLVETSYSDYKDFGGVQFPSKIVQTQGGFPVLDLTVSEVQPNAPADIAVPEPVQQAPPGAVRVESQKVADGTWYITGGSHHSVLVEFKDFVTVVEGPLTEERSLAVIAEVKKLVPEKPIKYLVNTHHHFDHLGGVRTYVAEGATIVTHESNKPYFEKVWQAPRMISADKLSQSPRPATFETFTDTHSLTDGARTLELHHIQGSRHNESIVMAWLPRERVLIEADVFTPPPPNAPPPAVVSVFTQNLDENIRRLKLDVRQILPIHGRIVTMADVRKALQKPS